MHRCDIDKPCVKFCESINNKDQCGMLVKRKKMLELKEENKGNKNGK